MAEEPAVGYEELSTTMTKAQQASIERRRQKALMLKQARLQSQSLAGVGQKRDPANTEVDTGAGFFVETQHSRHLHVAVVQEPGPVLGQVSDCLLCSECGKDFMESYIHNHFDEPVCDVCRNNNTEKYELITKTDAREKYLLKDVDFEVRQPPLKFLVRKNPRYNRWGDMKLFLDLQVHRRAMDVWGDEEKLEDERDRRCENREKAKKKNFDKRVRELRKSVRTSLWRKDITKHEHHYGEEMFDEDGDEYCRKCMTCGHEMRYEKM